MAVNYDVFMPYLVPLLPAVSEPAGIMAVRSACIDFCKGSLLLQQQMDAISTAAGESVYEIDVPTKMMLVQVMALYHDNVFLPRFSVAGIAARFSGDWQLMSGTPTVFTQLNPDEITLALTPDTSSTNALTGLIALAPSRDSVTLEDEQLFDRYVEVIVRGAAAKLSAIPNQPFSNATAAMVYNRQFNADVANVRAAVTAGQNASQLRVRFNSF